MGMNPATQAAEATSHAQYEIHEESLERKYMMFFTALIFTTLSFLISRPIKTDYIIVKCAEVSSWIFLLIAGVILLAQLAKLKFKLVEDKKLILNRIKNCINKNICESKKIYWPCYLLGIFLVISYEAYLLFH